jgi:exosortase/archaeosortase family protein
MLERTSQTWYLRPLTALGILTVEYLTITVGFDAEVLLQRAGAWEGLVWMGLLGPGVIAFGTALWILGGARLRDAFTHSASAALDPPPLWPRLAVYLACFAAFFGLTTVVFGDETPSVGPPPELWIFLWLLGGFGTLLSLVPIAAGGLRLRPLLRELAMPLGLASLLAVVAWGAGLATVGTEEFYVLVSSVCSGYEGIGLIVVFLSAYLVVFRDRFRFPHALLLLPVGILVVWLLNVVRIVALILVGHAGYANIAAGGFHSKAGWLFFCATALGAVWVSQQVRWFARDPNAPRGKAINPSAPFLLPLLAVVATALVSGLFVEELDYFYSLRVVVGLLVLAWYYQDYAAGLRQHLRGRSALSWHAVGVGVAAYVLWMGISALTAPYAPEAPPEALSELATPLVAVWIIGRMLGAVLVVPIVEELAFRGFLLRRRVRLHQSAVRPVALAGRFDFLVGVRRGSPAVDRRFRGRRSLCLCAEAPWAAERRNRGARGDQCADCHASASRRPLVALVTTEGTLDGVEIELVEHAHRGAQVRERRSRHLAFPPCCPY